MSAADEKMQAAHDEIYYDAALAELRKRRRVLLPTRRQEAVARAWLEQRTAS